MWVRVLLVAAFAFIVGYALRDIVRANPQLFGRRGPPRRRGPVRVPRPEDADSPEDTPRGKVLAFRRKPHEVLGVAADATVDQARDAWQALRDQNDPSKLEGMSEDLKALAEVRVKELDAAWQAFQDEQ